MFKTLKPKRFKLEISDTAGMTAKDATCVTWKNRHKEEKIGLVISQVRKWKNDSLCHPSIGITVSLWAVKTR